MLGKTWPAIWLGLGTPKCQLTLLEVLTYEPLSAAPRPGVIEEPARSRLSCHGRQMAGPGPKPTFRPGFDAALRLPETGHSHIMQHSRLVKVSCADLPTVRRICSVLSVSAKPFGNGG